MQEEFDKDHLKDELKNATDSTTKVRTYNTKDLHSSHDLRIGPSFYCTVFQAELENDIKALDAKENKTKADLDSVLDEDENIKDQYGGKSVNL